MTRVVCTVCNELIIDPKRTEITTKKHQKCLGIE